MAKMFASLFGTRATTPVPAVPPAKKVTISVDAGRASAKILWPELREYVIKTFGLVNQWKIYFRKTGEGAMKEIASLDHVETEYKIRSLSQGCTYVVEIAWTRNRGPAYEKKDKDYQYYLDDAYGCSFATIRTTAGHVIEAPSGFVDADKHPYKLWCQLRSDVLRLNKGRKLNVLLFGDAGSGKTSFLSTILSASLTESFEEQPPYASLHAAGGPQGGEAGHITSSLHKKALGETKRGVDHDVLQNIVVWDTWGLNEGNYPEGQLEAILRGKVKEGWQRIWPWADRHSLPYSRCINKDEDIEIGHRMHAVIFVIRASDIYVQSDHMGDYFKKFRRYNQECIAAGIIPTVLVSQVDLQDLHLSTNYKDVFVSEDIIESVDNLYQGAGFNRNQMFPCKLYSNEHFRSAHVEVTAMHCFRAALTKAKDFRDQLEAEFLAAKSGDEDAELKAEREFLERLAKQKKAEKEKKFLPKTERSREVTRPDVDDDAQDTDHDAQDVDDDAQDEEKKKDKARYIS